MGSIPQSPTKFRPRSRDTGFPEPFCGNRNTTLPHPDADLSPDACISADDIAVHKVLSRQRRSFMVKHKRTISYGKITPEMERMHSVGLGLLHEDASLESLELAQQPSRNLSRSSKDSGDSLAHTEDSGTGDESPVSPKEVHRLHKPRPDSNQPQRRRSLLRRLMHK